MHGFVSQTVGYVVVYRLWDFTGKDTTMQYETAVAIGGVVVVFVGVWVADLFWRFVDLPIVGFSRWLEDKVVAPGVEL